MLASQLFGQRPPPAPRQDYGFLPTGVVWTHPDPPAATTAALAALARAYPTPAPRRWDRSAPATFALWLQGSEPTETLDEWCDRQEAWAEGRGAPVFRRVKWIDRVMGFLMGLLIYGRPLHSW